MIPLEKWKILTHLQKLPNNLGNLGKIIVATGFEKLPKLLEIAQSGLTAAHKVGGADNTHLLHKGKYQCI